jgi:hypothetical protein
VETQDVPNLYFLLEHDMSCNLEVQNFVHPARRAMSDVMALQSESKLSTAQAEVSVCCLVHGVKIGDKRCRGISVVCGVGIHLRPTIGEWMNKFLTTGSLLPRKGPGLPSVWIVYGKPTYVALMKYIHQSPREFNTTTITATSCVLNKHLRL